MTGQCTFYNRGTSLFHSEFGVEGITNLSALNTSIAKASQWPVSHDNPVLFHRGLWWIKESRLEEAFGEIRGIETVVAASQLLQAEGLRYAIESNRRRKYQNSGSIPWQFNEPYPNGHCTSAVDYYAEPKATYYAIARAYEPVRVMAQFPAQAWGGHLVCLSTYPRLDDQLRSLNHLGIVEPPAFSTDRPMACGSRSPWATAGSS